MKVQNGHTVAVHYRGTLPEEENIEFDSSYRRGAPVEFEIGSGKMIKGFNDALLDMSVDETKIITLTPDEAYGPSMEHLFQLIPKTQFGEGFEFQLDGMIQGNGPMGPFIARIHEIKDEHVILDFNHPLSGKTLTFEITLQSISESAEPEVPVANWSASMKKAELLEIAKSQGLNVNTRSTKSQIVEALSAQ
jgi:peptidylprolyl isomerase|tara:strand:+ start:1792 stop:2367 length:576 start_codon:yes stop_codon:yes gene_type:complete